MSLEEGSVLVVQNIPLTQEYIAQSRHPLEDDSAIASAETRILALPVHRWLPAVWYDDVVADS